MIKKQGKQTIIRFGNGDINIVTGILQEEPLGVVAFREQEPRKIAMHNGDKPKKDKDEYPVIFNFANIDSVDVLIESLKILKKDMKNRDKILDSIKKEEE